MMVMMGVAIGLQDWKGVVWWPLAAAKKRTWALSTMNVTAWSSGLAQLHAWRNRDEMPDFTLVQETRLDSEGCEQASADLCKLGLRGVFGPAVHSRQGGRSGGVGIVCKRHIGMQEIPTPSELAGRIVAARCASICTGSVILASVYLPVDQTEAQLLHTLRVITHWLDCIWEPYILGGDWNWPQDKLKALHWAETLQGVVVGPGVPTCVARCIDYYVVHAALLRRVCCVRLVQPKVIRTHEVVQLCVRGRASDDN
eukprot:3311564-Amphidinium_carterae.1